MVPLLLHSQEEPKAAYYFNPDFSPDGSQIIFESTRDGNFAIYAIRIDGSGLRKLTNGEVNDSQARWSSDGGQIVFISDRDGHGTHEQIYIMDADGSNQRRITNDSVGNFLPDLSPDGNQVVFTSSPRQASRGTEIFTIRTDGTRRFSLTNYGDSETGNPRWSPDGKQILFSKQMIFPDGFPKLSSQEKLQVRNQVKNSAEIFIMETDGSHARNLTNNSFPEGDAHWSKDGKKIYFISEQERTSALFVMNSDGSQARKLAVGDFVHSANLSRDGKYFVYSKEVFGKFGLFIYDREEMTERLLIGG